MYVPLWILLFFYSYTILITNKSTCCTSKNHNITEYALHDLTLCMLAFQSSGDIPSKIISRIPSECQSVLDPGQARHFGEPDLDLNCLHRVSAAGASSKNVE